MHGNITKPMLGAACILILATASSAQEGSGSPGAIAKAYLAAYLQGDVDGMADYLAEDAVFEDPAVQFEGKQAVVEGLRTAFSSMEIEGFDVSRELVSGGVHVLVQGIVRFSQDGEFVGLPKETFRFKLPMAVSLKISNGKVVRHVILLETEEYTRQLFQQMSEKGYPAPGGEG